MTSKAKGVLFALAAAGILLTAGILAYTLLKDDERTNEDDNPISDWAGPYLDEKNSTSGGIEDVVEANNEFGIDMLKALHEAEEGNIFISPYSIFTALSMTYEGARGNTADEMKDVLHLPANEKERLGSFAKVQNDINKGSDQYELATANAIWPKVQYEWKELFIDTIKQYYYGKVQELDYIADTEACRETINTWVENQTNDRILDLIPPGLLGPLTYMVLTNAIYFKGEWVFEFDEDDTKKTPFHSPGGDVEVDMMHLKVEDDNKLPYYENTEFQAVELPYKGDELSMVIILPRDGDIDSLITDMEPDTLSSINNGLFDVELDVHMPKFKLETKYELVPIMKQLGMNDAFISGLADFSGMSDEGVGPYISNIIHQTFIEVDEKGTEAAAATAVVMRELLPSAGYYFNANEPFLFYIQQRDTGNILFMGAIKDPSLSG
ncbi:MAG: serpin family protein [Candidatus Thermoplasmatota archaeon]|nr:serpin family protein [Candidatus Thermoplasmatota archaeon]